MDASINSPIINSKPVRERVWYAGTDAVKKGEAFCYSIAEGTATLNDGTRGNIVTRPSTTNNLAFAGVADQNYAASSTGTFIDINVPGSTGVEVALGVDTVLNTGMLTFQVGGGNGAAGRFVKAGFAGRGSIIPRQTVTAVIEASMTGGWSLATDGVTLTVSDTTGLSAGDSVVLLGGKNEGSSKAIVAGKYTISSITSSTVLVLTATAVGATPSGALTCTGYAYTGNPRCQADLLTGEESGGCQFVSPPATGGAAVMTFMAGGFTYICGGLTIASAVANGALAEGTYPGARKGFGGLGTLTTNGVTITPASTGYLITGATLTTVTIDAASEIWTGQWAGCWATTGTKGATGA